MNEKLRPIAVEEYSKAFAKKVCTGFFANQSTISGKQILSFCNIYQVNLFILYKIFDRWQNETAKLKSPYFDYNRPEVQEAMTVFMNTLSQHIAIKQEDFEPLVIKSVADTLRLMLSPMDFFKIQLTHNQIVRISRLKEMQKYIHLNKFLFKELIDRLESIYGEELDWEKAVSVLNDVYQLHKGNLDASEPLVEVFSKKVPLYVEDLKENPRTQIPLPNLNTTVSFFDSDITDRYSNGYNIPSADQLGKDMAKISSNGNGQNNINIANRDVPLHQLYHANQTLNDKVGENVAENFLQRQLKLKITNIRNSISLNQKFIFVGELFGGDANVFQRAIDEVEACPDAAEATLLLKTKYAGRFEWDFASEPVNDFLEIVERRFL
jgi:hypothetical protein